MFVQDFFEENQDLVGTFSFFYATEAHKNSLKTSYLRDDFIRNPLDEKVASGPYQCLYVQEDIELAFENEHDVRMLQKGSFIYKGNNGFDVIQADHIGSQIILTTLNLPRYPRRARASKAMRDYYFN